MSTQISFADLDVGAEGDADADADTDARHDETDSADETLRTITIDWNPGPGRQAIADALAAAPDDSVRRVASRALERHRTVVEIRTIDEAEGVLREIDRHVEAPTRGNMTDVYCDSVSLPLSAMQIRSWHRVADAIEDALADAGFAVRDTDSLTVVPAE